MRSWQQRCADLKEAVQRRQKKRGETKAVTEDWMLVLGQREILRKKMDIINFVLKFHDYKCLEMAQNFVSLRIINDRRKRRGRAGG